MTKYIARRLTEQEEIYYNLKSLSEKVSLILTVEPEDEADKFVFKFSTESDLSLWLSKLKCELPNFAKELKKNDSLPTDAESALSVHSELRPENDNGTVGETSYTNEPKFVEPDLKDVNEMNINSALLINSRMEKLILTAVQDSNNQYTICAGDIRLIGRQPENRNAITPRGIYLVSKSLSRHHADIWGLFTPSSIQWQVRDAGSSLGTYLNGKRLGPPSTISPIYTIKDGDIIQFGLDAENSKAMIFKVTLVNLNF